MALADIIKKIETEAHEESAAILQAAQQRASEILERAGAEAARKHDAALAEATEQAQREAARTVVAARLAARDEGLTRKRALVSEVLEQVVTSLPSAPAGVYAGFLARQVAAVARGGEIAHLGSADAHLADALAEGVRMSAPGLDMTIAAEPAPFKHGVLLVGDRVRVDLSLASIVGERREELEHLVASILFERGD